jgi:hypothetical protein
LAVPQLSSHWITGGKIGFRFLKSALFSVVFRIKDRGSVRQ